MSVDPSVTTTSAKFAPRRPCTGECTDEGSICEGCGRSHEEIAEMKSLTANMVAFAKKMDYENVEEFANSVSGNIKYKMGV